MPAVIAITTADLPGLSAAGATAASAVARWLSGRATEHIVSLRSLGEALIRFQSTIDGSQPIQPEDPIFVLRFLTSNAGERDFGQVSIESALASLIVSQSLGRPLPRMLRALGRGERGVLAAYVAAVFRSLGSPLRLSLEHRGALPSPDAASILLDVSMLGSRGSVRLVVPLGWLKQQPPPARADAGALVTTAVVELEATALPAVAWRDTVPGDAVVFTGCRMVEPETPWAVNVRLGRHCAGALLHPDGSLRLTTGFRTIPRPQTRSQGTSMIITPPSPSAPSAGDSSVAPAAVLEAAPVEIVAELARLRLRGAEVLQLVPGSVLTLPGRRSLTVALCAGGEIRARGELVSVDGELGVRVTELVASGIPGAPPSPWPSP